MNTCMYTWHPTCMSHCYETNLNACVPMWEACAQEKCKDYVCAHVYEWGAAIFMAIWSVWATVVWHGLHRASSGL